jgi:hypothetical protein
MPSLPPGTAKTFAPQFRDVHKDVERYLVSLGKRSRTPDGFVMFTGYDAGRDHVIDLYFSAQAYEPLVDYFRNWNWEQAYNDRLHSLTQALASRDRWPLLKRLWDGVLSKRRSHYNSAWRIRKRDPAALSAATFDRVTSLLNEVLRDYRDLARRFGAPADLAALDAMAGRVEKGGKA